MKTFTAILYQEYLINKRSLSNLLMAIGMPVAFFLLFTTIWANDKTVSKDILEQGIRQYMLQMTAFSSLSFAFFTLPYAFFDDRRENRLRSIQHSPIPIWQYYASKMLSILVHYLLAIAVVFAVGHFAKGVNMSADKWLMSAVLLFVGAILFMPFGTLFSHIQSSQTLSIVANIFYMGLAVLGGLWMPVQSFPDFMQKIAKLTPTYHLNNLLISYFKGHFSFQSLLILFAYAMIVLTIALVIGKKREVK